MLFCVSFHSPIHDSHNEILARYLLREMSLGEAKKIGNELRMAVAEPICVSVPNPEAVVYIDQIKEAMEKVGILYTLNL